MRALPSNSHSRLCLKTPKKGVPFLNPHYEVLYKIKYNPNYRGFLRDNPLGGFLRQSLK